MGKGKHRPSPTHIANSTPDVSRGGKGKRKQKGLLAFQGREEPRYTGQSVSDGSLRLQLIRQYKMIS